MRGLPPEKFETAGLPLFDHAKKVEKERQLAEQREITQNATGEDILDSSPKTVPKNTENNAEIPKTPFKHIKSETRDEWEGLYPPDEDDVYKGPKK